MITNSLGFDSCPAVSMFVSTSVFAPWPRGTLKYWICVVLVVVTVVVFGRVGGHQFLIWDDELHVVGNPRLNPVTWGNVGEFWTEPRKPYGGLDIPLIYTFFAAEAWLCGV